MSAQRVHLDSRKIRKIRAVDFYGLVYATMQAMQDPRIGFEHVSKTPQEFFAGLQKELISVRVSDLEPLLYSANMLNERESFSHPLGEDFDTLLKHVLFPKEKFNRELNIIEYRRKL